jgi:hypothetical protein
LTPSGRAHAMTPRLGWEFGIAHSSFDHVEDGAPFDDTGRWLPRVAVVTAFDLPWRTRLTPMIEYVERGETRTSTDPFFSEKERFREQSLGVSLLWSHPVFLRVAFATGPELTYLVRGLATGTHVSGSMRPSEYRIDYTDEGSRTDLLARLGLEINLPMGRHELAVHCRYALGLSDQARAPTFGSQRNLPWTATSIPMSRSKTRSADVGLGFYW